MKPDIISENDILEVLKAIDDESITVKLDSDPEDLECGYPIYKTSNGWRFKVYSDQGVWHHIHEVWNPQGVHLDPWEERWMSEYRGVRYYDPPKKIVYPAFRLKPSNSVPQDEVA